jgi:hypothetical protein
MNTIMAVRRAPEYDLNNVINLIGDIYKVCNGPDVRK